MPPQHLPNPLTLIVATTPIPPLRTTPTGETIPSRLGIGLNGTLPWPRIKADMSFFARVTSRPPRAGTTSAIIMGRKTYDSVPKSLRPLGKRINVVVTRDTTGSVRDTVRKELEEKRKKAAATAAAATATGAVADGTKKEGETPETDALVSSGLEDALETLGQGYGAQGKLGNVFVIGGAEIYAAALRMGGTQPVRIVMTNVEKKNGEPFECDTFFPVDEELLLAQNGWRKVGAEEVTEWVGESVSGEWKEEGDVRVQMVGYERV